MHQISNIYFVIKFYMFRASSMPIIRSYLLYTQQLVRFMQTMWPLPSRVWLGTEFQPNFLHTAPVLCLSFPKGILIVVLWHKGILVYGKVVRQWRTQEFFWGWGGSTNSVEDRGQRGRGSGGGSPLVRGSGGSCNLVQEISFHIVKFS